MASLQAFLYNTRKYPSELIEAIGDNETPAIVGMKNLKKLANRGEISSEVYFKTALQTLGVLPEDIPGALEAIRYAQYNIRLFDGVVPALASLVERDIILGIITDSMSSTTQKLEWVKRQGLDPSWYGKTIMCYCFQIHSQFLFI